MCSGCSVLEVACYDYRFAQFQENAADVPWACDIVADFRPQSEVTDNNKAAYFGLADHGMDTVACRVAVAWLSPDCVGCSTHSPVQSADNFDATPHYSDSKSVCAVLADQQQTVSSWNILSPGAHLDQTYSVLALLHEMCNTGGFGLWVHVFEEHCSCLSFHHTG